MHIAIIGGTGFIGKALVKHFLQLGNELTVIGRTTSKIKKCFPRKVNALALSELTSNNLHSCDVVINLAGANIGDKPWRKKRKQEIFNSRIDTTKKIVNLLLTLKNPPALFNASAIGVYDLQEAKTDEYFDENTPLDPNAKPNFLADVAREWEKATQPAKEKNIRVVNMRFGVVIDKSGGVYKKLVLPFYIGLGGKMGSGRQAFSWIALSDLIRAIDFLIARPDLSGPINIVSPHCITQATLAKAIARNAHRPAFITMPAWLLKMLFGQMGVELLIKGQFVKPTVLTEAGFVFEKPDIASAIAASCCKSTF